MMINMMEKKYKGALFELAVRETVGQLLFDMNRSAIAPVMQRSLVSGDGKPSLQSYLNYVAEFTAETLVHTLMSKN